MSVGFKTKMLDFKSQLRAQLKSQHCPPEINLPVSKQVNLAGGMDLGFQSSSSHKGPWGKVGGRVCPCLLGGCGQPCISSPLPHHV